jgi:hypothetical protein
MKLDLKDFRDPMEWQSNADILNDVQVGMRLEDVSPAADLFQYFRSLTIHGVKRVMPYVVGEMLLSLEQDESPFSVQIGYFVGVMADSECHREFESGLSVDELRVLRDCLQRVIVRFRSAVESATSNEEADYLQVCLRDAEIAAVMWGNGAAGRGPENGTSPQASSDRQG